MGVKTTFRNLVRDQSVSICMLQFLRCVEWRAGTILFGHLGGVDGGTVRIFLSFWLCSGGYGTVEMVKGVVRVFSLLSSVCCQFSWRLDICGRNFCVIFFVGSFVVFFAVSYFTRC
jgi:hypothetical protein